MEARHEIFTPAHREAWLARYRALARKHVFAHPDYLAFLARRLGQGLECLHVADTASGSWIWYPWLRRALADGPGVRRADLSDRVPDRSDIQSSWYYGGPLSNSEHPSPDLARAFDEALCQTLRATGCVTEFVRFDANLQNQSLFPTTPTISFDRETVPVDLTKGHEAAVAAFDPATRRGIAKARRAGLTCVEHGADDAAAWAAFAEVYGAEMARKNAPERLRFDSAYFEALRRAVPDALRLVTAHHDDAFAGGFIILADEDTAFHFLSASWPDFWPQRVNNLLFSEAIRWAAESGRTRFDFMGGRGGVFRFKSGFSPLRGRFHVMKRVHDAATFNRIAAALGPTDPQGPFPPWL